jgi:hypothetical protein
MAAMARKPVDPSRPVVAGVQLDCSASLRPDCSHTLLSPYVANVATAAATGPRSAAVYKACSQGDAQRAEQGGGTPRQPQGC